MGSRSFGTPAGRAFCAVILVLLVAGPLPERLPAQFGTTNQSQQISPDQAEIREAQENLRRLYSQGEYQRVLDEADALLARDPDNSTAIMQRALAERRIARGDTLPSGPDAARTRGGTLDRSAIEEATERLIEPPPPLEPRRTTGRTAAFGDLLAQYRQEIIVAGAILLALLILLFLWLWKRSRDEAVPAAASGSGNIPLSDMPTQVQRSSEQKPVGTVPRKVRRKPVKAKAPKPEPEEREEPSGISEEDDPEETLRMAPPPRKKEKKQEEPEAPAAPPPSDSLVLDDYHSEEKQEPEIGSSLGIDYSETENLQPEGIGTDAGDEEKTFNSLMFGEETEVKKPATSDDKKEELSKSQFDDEFANMMFGEGSEDTVLTPPPGKETEAGDDEQTLLTPPPAKDKPADKGSKDTGKVSMFDRQRQTGEEALKEGDYGRAVQCLSVAASLRPGDKDVRALLEEARKKKRGG